MPKWDVLGQTLLILILQLLKIICNYGFGR